MRVDMKLVFGVVLVLAVANALPADQRPLQLGRVELEKDSEEFPIGLPIPRGDGFFGGITDIFERMREQMLYLLSHVPTSFRGSDEGNTTSVTKVIDGHKVTINETVYTSGNSDDASAVFKVRIVDIHPDSEAAGDDSVESTNTASASDSDKPPRKASAESLELSNENEITHSLKQTAHQQKRKVNNMDYLDDDLVDNFHNLETFDDANNELDEYDGLETFDDANNALETFDEDIDDDKDSAENSIENEIERGPVIDLSNDIRVNEIAEQNGRAPNPDAEFLPDFQPPRDLSRDIYINEIARKAGRRPNPDAEVFASSPHRNDVYDLSRDTYVNEIGNLPINPDAEFVQPFPSSRYYYRTDNS